MRTKDDDLRRVLGLRVEPSASSSERRRSAERSGDLIEAGEAVAGAAGGLVGSGVDTGASDVDAIFVSIPTSRLRAAAAGEILLLLESR